jgi:hypothetical protein
MNAFNKYLFIDELEKELTTLIKDNALESYDDIQEYIFQEIDNACIYYAQCFQIVMELGVTEFGDAKNITDLACISLNEYVQENINMNELTELL